MTLVVLGIDALDPELISETDHPDLVLESHASIETLTSVSGAPSTHELWPTIITGLRPAEHGLELDDGVAWDHPILSVGSDVADHVLPARLQTRLGSWLLDNTSEDAFRTPATYYAENDLGTVFDGRRATAIGIPNYVTDPDHEDREHQLRRDMGALFERDDSAPGGHRSEDPLEFYERCMEMAMIRIALVRRALRSREHELVFGYTSGLDLIGHVTHDLPDVQRRAYDELDDFVAELRADLGDGDELVLVSDHGLQDGIHTDEAMVAATAPTLVDQVSSVLDVKAAIERELDTTDHVPDVTRYDRDGGDASEDVADHLEALGYM